MASWLPPLSQPHIALWLPRPVTGAWLLERFEEPFPLTPQASSHQSYDFLPQKSGVQSQATANICYIPQHVHKPGTMQRLGLMLGIASMWCNKRQYQNQKCFTHQYSKHCLGIGVHNMDFFIPYNNCLLPASNGRYKQDNQWLHIFLFSKEVHNL